MSGQTIEFVGILVTVAGLLGWLMRQVIIYFIKNARENSDYIEKLVSSNQTNTENFINTINHQRTKDREMQDRQVEAIKGLSNELINTNKINGQMLDFFKEQSKK